MATKKSFNELIKSFDKIREYIRQFYIYGYKNRDEIGIKSARSYDNERRRIASWLSDYMDVTADRSQFISVDARHIQHNPLYKAFKAKSFTDKDITLHFIIMDIFASGEEYTLRDFRDAFTDYFEADILLEYKRYKKPINGIAFDGYDVDDSTLRTKLNEYLYLGLLQGEKRGKEFYYSLSQDKVKLEKWETAIAFFSEAGNLGVVGSYLLDKFAEEQDICYFKHHYLFQALESEIFFLLADAMRQHKAVKLESLSTHKREVNHKILPLRFYISTQSGRRYVVGYCFKLKQYIFYRLDNIQKVVHFEYAEDYEEKLSKFEEIAQHLWGVSLGRKVGDEKASYSYETVELVVKANEDEKFIVQRLEREKRCGSVIKLSDNLYQFSAQVCDAHELTPFLRTFIGRIVSFKCSNKHLEEHFWADIQDMYKMYDLTLEDSGSAAKEGE